MTEAGERSPDCPLFCASQNYQPTGPFHTLSRLFGDSLLFKYTKNR
jgi:hypothetical protein